MKNFWTVFRFEMLLSWRGYMGGAVTLVMALLGVGLATQVNQINELWWGNLCLFLGLLTLLLALTTGNQIHRDSERRLDGIIMSTSVRTATYVLSKYLAGLFTLIIYACVTLCTLLIASTLLSGENYYTPPLGPGVYTQVWLLLVLVPLIFAASLMLIGTTLARGQRALISIFAVLIWMVAFAIPVPKLLTISFYLPHGLATNGYFFIGDSDFIDSAVKLFVRTNLNHQFTHTTVQQMVHLYQTVVIPEHMSANFLFNRIFFLGLSLLLLLGTIEIVRRKRQGRI